MLSRRYTETRRRMLLDMHIPDWDTALLASYEPDTIADAYATAGAEGALLYCKAHTGLQYWPSPVGGIHRAAAERDLVGEVKAAMEHRGIATAAYHSVIFDNWAAEHHPEWRTVRGIATSDEGWHKFSPRYGLMCANRIEYQAYERQQITALLTRYDFEALWLDMAFWTTVCVCEVCRARFRAETGEAIPTVVDWADPLWCAFQAARERWIEEFLLELRDAARAVRPTIQVTHNLATGLSDWVWGQRADHARHDSFAAGDLYGGREQEIFVLAAMRGLAPQALTEFMTSRTRDLQNHTSTKSEHEMTVEALAAVAYDSAFLFIDAIDPVGTVNRTVYERIGRVFERSRAYDPYLGGEPMNDVAVYYSDDSRVDQRDDGRPLSDPLRRGSAHQQAVWGVCRILRRAHIPFGVVFPHRLEELSRYRALVLPEVTRMTEPEIEAIRDFVESGGLLYASGRTSLLGTDGERHEDFRLADLFGCHYDGDEHGAFLYARPSAEWLAESLRPERYLPATVPTAVNTWPPRDARLGHPRVRGGDGEALATLTIPFGYPSPGSLPDRDFASIHSSPPWSDLDAPVIVSSRRGRGAVVYSAHPLEFGKLESHEHAFLALLENALHVPRRVVTNAHPDVWVTVFDHGSENRLTVSALNWCEEPEDAVRSAKIRIHTSGREVARVELVPQGTAVPFTIDDDWLTFELDAFDLFAMAVVYLV